MRRACSALLGLLFAGLAPLAAGDSCRGSLYLSFDTGGMHQAEPIARVLAEENVRATFFLANEKTFRGDHALDPAWDGYWKRLADAGHAFGNHTWSHYTLRRDRGDRILVAANGRETEFDQRQFCAELTKVDDAFRRASGRRLAGLWRAPGGRTTPQALRWAAACGYPVHVHWDAAGFIGDELPSERYPNALLLERALKDIRAGDVLMMHLGIYARKEPAAPILQPLIRGLKARGFCFATLDVARR
jgi:peptidoglycan/xylan/chitin deacetylase (PgdA/CDA1 family)